MKIVFLIGLVLLIFGVSFPQLVKGEDPSVVVSIQNSQFSPATVTVASGSTVTWVNNDSISHTTTADNMNAAESWDSGNLAPGQSYSKTLVQTGTYTYHCNLHPNMKGTINVVAGAATKLPATGTPLKAYLLIGLMLLGLKLVNYNGEGTNDPLALRVWKKRQFKL